MILFYTDKSRPKFSNDSLHILYNDCIICNMNKNTHSFYHFPPKRPPYGLIGFTSLLPLVSWEKIKIIFFL